MHLEIRKLGDRRDRSLSTNHTTTTSIIADEGKEMVAA
jgi:hypothetical protein